MAALPLNTSACVTLSVVSDDPLCAEQLLSFLTDPAISVSNAIVTETGMLPSLSVQSDVVLLIVNSPDIAPVIAGIKTAKVLRGTLKILVLDRSPTVERAVEFMKCGVSDYTEFHEDKAGEHAVRVEQACLDILFDIPEPAVLRGSNKPPEILSLHRKVQKVVRAAKELSSCRTLQAVCERLLETVGDALGATGGSLYLQDGNILRRAHTLDPGHAPEILELPLPTGSLFEQVYSSKEPLIISESSELPGEYSSGWQGYQGESVLVYPLVERSGELIGLFSLHGKKRDIFTKDDRDLVLILAAYSLETIRALLVQERLQEAFNSLSMTFENMSEGIILLDEERRIVQCNQNVARILRLSEDELASGTSIVELCSSLYARGDSTEKANGENPWDAAAGDFSYEHYCNDGAVIRFSGKLLENGANVLTISDITAQKNWETELCLAKDKAEAANASKTNFLANISHELRTPLNAIIGFSEMMRSEVYGALGHEKYDEYVAYINDSGSHLLSLINNLLDLSKAEAGKFKLHKTQLNLSALVANIVAYFRHQSEMAGVALVLKGDGSQGNIEADENAVRQICYNLLSNAIKFTPRGGSVTIELTQESDGRATIAVSDTGIGMDEKSIETALQPFGQVENAFNRKYAGTGLGLPLVSSLCELHEGEFNITSRPGFGTTCIVSIPGG